MKMPFCGNRTSDCRAHFWATCTQARTCTHAPTAPLALCVLLRVPSPPRLLQAHRRPQALRRFLLLRVLSTHAYWTCTRRLLVHIISITAMRTLMKRSKWMNTRRWTNKKSKTWLRASSNLQKRTDGAHTHLASFTQTHAHTTAQSLSLIFFLSFSLL